MVTRVPPVPPTRASKAVPLAGEARASGPPDGGAQYSIRVTSRLTAIELDTLRMWERRYGFPRPERTGGGSRVYSESDVEVLKLIRRAIDNGYRPGEVVGKPREELMQLILATSEQPRRATSPVARGTAQSSADPAGIAPSVPSLLAALGRDEVAEVRTGLRQCVQALGSKRFLTEVAHPLCIQVGEMWASGKLEVRHEHLLSECLSAQLRVMMSAYEDHEGAPRVLLSTLPEERHGLGLAMVEVYLAIRQVTPILLGVDTPAEQILKAARSHAADAVGLLVTEASDVEATAKHLRWMLAELPRRVALWVGGAGAPRLKMRDELRIVSSWSDLDAAIAALPRRTA
jgi:methanogenic corrinoid protein MtbC1